jgi:hypothetical protein
MTALSESIVALAPAAENAGRHTQPVTFNTSALQADQIRSVRRPAEPRS